MTYFVLSKTHLNLTLKTVPTSRTATKNPASGRSDSREYVPTLFTKIFLEQFGLKNQIPPVKMTYFGL